MAADGQPRAFALPAAGMPRRRPGTSAWSSTRTPSGRGGTGRVLGFAVKAASTLGTFLRSFRWGHVRRLDLVSRELLGRAWAAGAGPAGGPLTWRRTRHANGGPGSSCFRTAPAGSPGENAPAVAVAWMYEAPICGPSQ